MTRGPGSVRRIPGFPIGCGLLSAQLRLGFREVGKPLSLAVSRTYAGYASFELITLTCDAAVALIIYDWLKPVSRSLRGPRFK